MSKFFLDLLCGYAPSPLATCAAQIHTTLCGQFLLSMFALSCDRARGALPKARFWRGALSSRARSAVSRDGDRRFIRFTIKAWSLAVLCGYTPLSQPARHKFTPLSAVNIFRRYLPPFLLWAVPRMRNKRYANYRFKAISSRLGIGRVRVFGCGRGCGV